MKNTFFALLLAWACLLSVPAHADRVTGALKKLKKNHLDEARMLAGRALRRQPLNAGAHYVLALCYVRQYLAAAGPQPTASLSAGGREPGHEALLDSAFASARRAAAAWPLTERPLLRRWAKAGLTSRAVQAAEDQVDSLAFFIAATQNSVAGFQSYLVRFPEAGYQPLAIEKRDELAFQEASAINTYTSYKRFLDTYPGARQTREAEKMYELLLFEFLTLDDDLPAYVRFLEVHPRSPYRDEAERRLYERATIGHTREAYLSFVRRFPQSPHVPQAWHWIYALHRRDGLSTADFLAAYPDFFDKPYLQKRMETDSLAYFPVYDEQKQRFGFMDANGRMQVQALYDSVPAPYFCTGVKHNTMQVYRDHALGAVDKTGREITGFGYSRIEPLEGELMLVEKNGQMGVWHAAGFAVLPVQYQAVEVLNETFLLIKEEGKYGLATFYGGRVGEVVYDQIKNLEEGLLAFRLNGRFAVVPAAALLQRKFPVLSFLYDAVEWVRHDALKVRIGDYEGVVNTQLQHVVTPAPVRLSPLPAGWVAHAGRYRQLLDSRGRLLADSLDDALGNASFYAARRGGQWAVWKTSIAPRLKFDSDTVMLLGQDGFAVKKAAGFYVFFAPDVFLKLGGLHKVSLVQLDGQPRHRWLLVEEISGEKGLLTAKGQPVLPAKYSQITVWTPDLIAVQAGGKWGLVDGAGKTILPMLYTALSYDNGFVSTLKNGKFGLLHLGRGIDIPPQYERLVRPYTENSLLFVGMKNGRSGFVTADNEPVSEFQFEEVRYWQYGVALVKQADGWRLYHIADKKFVSDPIEEYRLLRDDAREISIRIYSGRKYGVLSNVRGAVVEAEYDDLRNVGTPEIPFYLAEKHSEATGAYVISYLDRTGRPVQKQVFDPQRYERMMCE